MARPTRATRSGRLVLRLLAPAAIGLCIAGCRTEGYRVEPFTTDQVLQMSSQQAPADDIIRKIRESRTVYHLRAREVKSLLDQGVDEKVVDEMMDTPIREAEYYAWKYSYPYYPYYYYPSAYPYHGGWFFH